MENTPKTLEQEIGELEQMLKTKKDQREGAPETMPSEHEMVKQAIGERIQQTAPAAQSVPQPAPLSAQDQSSYGTPALKDAVQQLVNIAFTSGLDDAIRQAAATKNPALIDAFHDVLADQLFSELIARRKLNPVQ